MFIKSYKNIKASLKPINYITHMNHIYNCCLAFLLRLKKFTNFDLGLAVAGDARLLPVLDGESSVNVPEDQKNNTLKSGR